jgi:hypothetical protein
MSTWKLGGDSPGNSPVMVTLDLGFNPMCGASTNRFGAAEPMKPPASVATIAGVVTKGLTSDAVATPDKSPLDDRVNPAGTGSPSPSSIEKLYGPFPPEAESDRP